MMRRAVPTIAFSVGLLIAMRTEMLGAINLSPAAPAQDPSKTATYTGKIVSQNGVRFILRDETNDTWYHLDDQQQAGKFLGKTVSVVGVLDGPTNTIRVKSIAEAKS
jgi:hypothetical protein